MIWIPNLLISSNRSVHSTTNGFLWGFSRYFSFNKNSHPTRNLASTKIRPNTQKLIGNDNLRFRLGLNIPKSPLCWEIPATLRQERHEPNPFPGTSGGGWSKKLTLKSRIFQRKVYVQKNRKGTKIGMFFPGGCLNTWKSFGRGHVQKQNSSVKFNKMGSVPEAWSEFSTFTISTLKDFRRSRIPSFF